MTLYDVDAVAFIHRITVYRKDGSLHPLNNTYTTYDKKLKFNGCEVTRIYVDMSCDIQNEGDLSVYATPLLCVNVLCKE